MVVQNPTALLMIEPNKQREEPVYDELTRMAEAVWQNSVGKLRFYRGYHVCMCGERSDNDDYLTKQGRLTNSLMVHYVRDHRSCVPETEINKLKNEYATL